MTCIQMFGYKTEAEFDKADLRLSKLSKTQYIGWGGYDYFDVSKKLTDIHNDDLVDYGSISIEGDDNVEETLENEGLKITLDEVREHIGYFFYICKDNGGSNSDMILEKYKSLEAELYPA